MGPKGYLTDIGLVPLDKKSYKKTRTAGTKLTTIKLNQSSFNFKGLYSVGP